MIIYKYSFIKDIRNFLNNHNRKDFFRKERIVYFPFNLKRFFIILFRYYFGKIILPKININQKIDCYIVTSGTWGAYELPNKIYILPWKIEEAQDCYGFEDLIFHEIKHLKAKSFVKENKLNHKEKEYLINNMD